MARRMSRGFRRQQQRKFVWHRHSDAFTINPDGTGVYGSDLLSEFRDMPGATHLGATVMRVRGWVFPQIVDAPPVNEEIAGLRVDTWDQPVDTNNVSPFQGPDEDWMAWFPYLNPTSTADITGNVYASPFAVDVKSNRKLEELNQTLWLFGSGVAGATVTYIYNLSIGLKLA